MPRLFVDNLTVIDFSFLDSERGVVGESWIVDIELQGQLDHQGMVFDFGDVKKSIKRFIDHEFDHRLMIPAKYQGLEYELTEQQLCLKFILYSGAFFDYFAPKDSVLLIDNESVEIEFVARLLELRLREIVPSNVDQISIRLRPESIQDAYYHYTHGLQKHLGDCQRIAHGHRSRIEIYISGERNNRLEVLWAKQLKDVYIATVSHIKRQFIYDEVEYTHMAYLAEQGEFSLTLPKRSIFSMPMESTVENIATHIASIIASDYDESVEIKVKAFEGVSKGAYGFSQGSQKLKQ